MDLSERKKKILRAIVEDYIETAEPVGSKTISANSGLGLSSATIRNEMAELEQLGYLEQPHTSAGRIPTSRGYRIYVNELMMRQALSLEETEAINRELRTKVQQLDRLISEAGKLTAQLTHYPAYALTTAASAVTINRFDLISVEPNTFIIVVMLSSNVVKNKLMRLPFAVEPAYLTKLSTVFNASFTNITEEEITPALLSATERAVGDTLGIVSAIAGFAIECLYGTHKAAPVVTGTSHLLRHPEFQDVEKASRVLGYLSDGDGVLQLPKPSGSGDVSITIGPENLAEELKDSSVIVARYDAGDNMEGLIGVVGPTRMDYSRVAARLQYIANGLGRLLSGGEPPPVELTQPKKQGDDS